MIAMTDQERRQIFDLLRQAFPAGGPIPLEAAGAALEQAGVSWNALGFPTLRQLLEEMGDLVALEERSQGAEDGGPARWTLTLGPAEDGTPEPEEDGPGRCELTQADRKAVYRILWEHYPVHFHIPFTDAAPTLARYGYTPARFYVGAGKPKLHMLLEPLGDWVELYTAESGVCYLSLVEAPEALEGAPSFSGKRAGLAEEDRARICRCLAETYAPGEPVSVMALGSTLARHQIDLHELGFSRTARLLPCLLGDLSQAEPPAGAEPGQGYVRLEPSILRYLPQEEQTVSPASPDLPGPEQARKSPGPESSPAPEQEAAPAKERAEPAPERKPPERWQGGVYFHPKTQAILAGFLGRSALSQEQLAQIARDYDRAQAAGRLRWLPEKQCYTCPLSLRTPDGRYTLLSIKVNGFPGGLPWRVSFVGFRRPEAEERADPAPEPPRSAPVSSEENAPAPADGEPPAGVEASAAEITAPALSRLSDRDKLEIYSCLLPLNPAGVPVLLSVASSALANQGITPQRYGYARVLQLFSDMPEYFRISSVRPHPDAPLVYSITLLPLPGAGESPRPVEDQAAGDRPPFAMTERTIAFPRSQQGYLARWLNGPQGEETLTEEQISEFQTSYAAAVAAGELVYDPAYHCYRFPLSLVARDGRALRATIKRSDRPTPPAWYVSFIEKCAARGVKPGDKLKQFAYLGPEQEFLSKLAQCSEPEPWSFRSDRQDYAILWNYIAYTFYRLDYEGKVYIDPSGEFAAFNTGLLSRRFGEDVLAYFEPNTVPGGPKWRFVCFCSTTNEAATAAERRAVTLLAPLDLALPQYFSSLYDTMFDPNSRLECNFMHIVRDNLHRFPMGWLHKQCDDHRRTRLLLADIEAERARQRALEAQGDGDGAEACRQRVKQGFLTLGEAITDEEDEAMCDLLMDMKDLFESAVNRTLDLCRRNFKLAIPCYFPTRNIMSMLLPISFSRRKNGAPCMALVAERQKNGVYLGRTVLTMDRAYIDARLLCRPSSEWLDTGVIRAQLAGDQEG